MEEVMKIVSNGDGSVKYLFKLVDDYTIETLYMQDKNLKVTYCNTVCVSSQVGCNVGCIFCATGKCGYIRNLSYNEIVEQVNVNYFNNMILSKGSIDAVVFAGMGEPLFNYENVKKAIQKLYINIGIKNFEIVTVGVVPYIYKLITDFKNKINSIRLNISLHASTDDLRKKLIPYASKHSIEEIIKAASEYYENFNTKVRFRYMLLKDFNDSAEDVENLIRILENKPVKLIISQYNENNIPGLAAPSQKEVLEFYQKVSKKLDCGVFYNFGSDVKGGCGQLIPNQVKLRC
ncbi:MAG: radical SAM protein [Clostridia bacterium]|nr:radical SAM protein [Clostridia bacterium]